MVEQETRRIGVTDYLEGNEMAYDNLSGFKGIGFATVLGLVLIAIGYMLIRYVV